MEHFGNLDEQSENHTQTLGQSLDNFLQQLEHYTSTIPDAVTAHILQRAGFEPKDPRLLRLISIAAQKFISDIANDALLYCKMRSSSHSSSKKTGPKDQRYCLTLEDLSSTTFGMTFRQPHYYI
ncbi:hypothetical protein RN001_015656 [Aquatica leii]|uniref:Transcription initiation factor TFIID subunit 10 n=1 Tax=Aquatica leii TaxID=1421715 RepID=A0AAN7SAS0_9COLE|nr:hypothetical protein RN001_015656 [Aquatica leii]